MRNDPVDVNRRVLVIDDNQAIHEDFAKILCRDDSRNEALAEAEAALFGGSAPAPAAPAQFQIDSALQGQDGVAMVHKALSAERPYAMAFIDVRMPPGWDGVETAARIWEIDADIQIVICTAYSDYSWQEIRAKLGHSDRLFVLKKPFDNIEVLQLADALTHKWQRAHNGSRHLMAIQQLIRQRTNDSNTGSDQWNIDENDLAMVAQVVDTQVRQHLVLEDDLRNALESGQLTVHYQPLIDVATRRVASLEALVRWKHPTKGWISPAAFIPVAEESGLILPLGEFVLRTACEQVARWEREGVASVPVAVNISAVQLERQNIVDLVYDVLKKTQIRPGHLVLELTESTMIKNIKRHTAKLQTLRNSGVRIEIDDFGTGYSSLSYLKELPIDAVKIDRSFIRHIDSNPVDAAIISAVVAMAHSLNLRVVAEGVERIAQLEVLSVQGCDIAQGFLFSRALPADECVQLLQKPLQSAFPKDALRLVANASHPV